MAPPFEGTMRTRWVVWVLVLCGGSAGAAAPPRPAAASGAACDALFAVEAPVVRVAGPAKALAELRRAADDEPAPSTDESDAEAQAELCPAEGCGEQPLGVSTGSEGLTHVGVYLPGARPGVVRIATVVHEYHCTGALEIRTEAHGEWVRVVGYTAPPRVVGFDGSGKACDPEDEGCLPGCLVGKHAPFDWWIHPQSGQVRSLRHPERKAPAIRESAAGPAVGRCALRPTP